MEAFNEVMDIDTAINKVAEQIKIQLQSIAIMNAIPDLISIEDNIYENLSKEDAEKIAMQIKIALITLAAIKAMGLNKECVDYLLKYGPIDDFKILF